MIFNIQSWNLNKKFLFLKAKRRRKVDQIFSPLRLIFQNFCYTSKNHLIQNEKNLWMVLQYIILARLLDELTFISLLISDKRSLSSYQSKTQQKVDLFLLLVSNPPNPIGKLTLLAAVYIIKQFLIL